jgi:hypothetical protein
MLNGKALGQQVGRAVLAALGLDRCWVPRFLMKSGQEESPILYDGSELGQGDGSLELGREKDGSELGQRDGG